VRFLSDQGIALLRLRLREAVTKWWPGELVMFNALWESFEPFLACSLVDELGRGPDRASVEEALLKGFGFAAEELHNYATPHLTQLMSAVFAHLLGERSSSEISESRIREMVKAYASHWPVPGCSEQEVVARLTPLLWIDFRCPPAGLTYTPERFVGLDSLAASATSVHVPIDEIEAWRVRGEKRWLFLDDTKGRVVIGKSKDRRAFQPNAQARRLLRGLLSRASVGAVARDTLCREVWAESDVEGGRFRTAFWNMHKETGGRLKKLITIEPREEKVAIEIRESFLAIWFPARSRTAL